MIKGVDIAVIGAGALGAAIAYNLSIKSKLVIALIDAHTPGSQTSSRAAGMLSLLRKNPAMIALIKNARSKIENFSRELDQPLDWTRSGSLKIARRLQDNLVLEKDLERARMSGLNVERVSVEEATRLNPFLKSKGVAGALFVFDDCYFEPGQIAVGYAAAAVRQGVHLISDTAVTNILTSGDKVVGIATADGEISAAHVVDAAGAWTRQIAKLSGTSIPLIPTRQQAAFTGPLPFADANLPMIRIMDAAVYTRPYHGGLLWGVFEENPAIFDTAKFPPSFKIADLSLDISVLEVAARDVRQQLPILQQAGLRELRGGLPTMTPDGHHILGPAPGLDGFFFASGCNVAGLSISPAIGEVAADWILDGAPSADVQCMRADRFEHAEINDAELIESCCWQYRHFYGAA